MFVFLLFAILAISRFGFEGWVSVLIDSVPDYCIHTFGTATRLSLVVVRHRMSSRFVDLHLYMHVYAISILLPSI